jgi:hypothetical protein
MLSLITDQKDYQVPSQSLEYESIFKHYGFETQSQQNILRENEDKKYPYKNLFETKRLFLERNESNKKTINAKTIVKKSKQITAKNSPQKSKQPQLKVCSEKQYNSNLLNL